MQLVVAPGIETIHGCWTKLQDFVASYEPDAAKQKPCQKGARMARQSLTDHLTQ
jgi:hypothetical protein